MPEIAEGKHHKVPSLLATSQLLILSSVARIVHFLRLHLVGKKIKSASAQDDGNVFGKVGTTGAAVAAALKGRKVERTNVRLMSRLDGLTSASRSCLLAAKESTFGT